MEEHLETKLTIPFGIYMPVILPHKETVYFRHRVPECLSLGWGDLYVYRLLSGFCRFLYRGERYSGNGIDVKQALVIPMQLL